MAKVSYQKLENHSPFFWGLVALNGAIILAGLGAAYVMEHRGHIISGMNNQIVWGLPHVFAVFLIVAASGALNVASVSSVFNRSEYKPYARLSGLLAITLLVGGLSVLVLDLGRSDRLIVAMTTYNFKSIFAWNIYLYIGFLAIVAAYLFAMMDRRASRTTLLGKTVGWLAFVWRLVLTTGTGSIFGWLVARESYDAAIMAPLFIAASLLYGLAFAVLALAIAGLQLRQDLVTDEMLGKIRGLLVIFALAVLYFTAAHHLKNLYASEHRGVERFLLLEGGIYTGVFWVGQLLVGSVLPLAILAPPMFGRSPRGDHRRFSPVPRWRPCADVCHHHWRAGLSAQSLPGHGRVKLVPGWSGGALQRFAARGSSWPERTLDCRALDRHCVQTAAVPAEVS